MWKDGADKDKEKSWEERFWEDLECHSTSTPEDLAAGRESERCVLPPRYGDPTRIVQRFGRVMGGRPAPGVTVTPSELPQRASTLRQPISSSTATAKDNSTTNVQVESEPGHILHTDEGANGLNYSATANKEGGVDFDMESYGDTPHPRLRRFANRNFLRPSWMQNIRGSVEEDEKRGHQGDGGGTV